jgi:3-O-methylgallate 3,4-dioxygenase
MRAAEAWSMAEIVLGVGTSHSPSMSMGPQWWSIHGTYFDPKLEKITDFEERCANAPAWLRAELEQAVFDRKHEAVNVAIAAIGTALRASKPDVVVVIGDDQKEMFLDELPALSLFAADTLLDLPADVVDGTAPSIKAAQWAIHGEEPVDWPASKELGTYLARTLTAHDFDVNALSRQPEKGTLGHAFTFVNRRLYTDGPRPAMCPVFLNTYYPPTQMRAARCWKLGQAIREAIDAWDSDARVAIVGSGGLSHFILDPELDKRVLDALKAHDGAAIAAIPETTLQSGTSEIKNWIVAGAALEGFTMRVVDYIPAWRTGAATGIGLGFALWEKPAAEASRN